MNEVYVFKGIRLGKEGHFCVVSNSLDMANGIAQSMDISSLEFIGKLSTDNIGSYLKLF